MSESRPPIPEPVKREVRQRCGFGCVVCGLPIYEYDHMTSYSVVQGHTAANLTLLCPEHHSQKTKGLLSEKQVRASDAAPSNRAAGHSRPMELFMGTQTIAVKIATNFFVSTSDLFMPIVVDGIALIAVEIESGQALLQALFLNEYNEPMLEVVDNEVVYHTKDPWDIEFVGQSLTLRSAPRQIELRLGFDPAGVLTIERARMYCNGVLLEVDGDSLVIGEEVRVRGSLLRGQIGLLIGYWPLEPPGAVLRLRPSRYRGSALGTV